MITELKSQNSLTNRGKTWCEDCPKTLAVEEAGDHGMAELEQSVIDYLLGLAEHHEHHHPTHNIFVTIYERVPSIQEIKRAG